MWSWTNRYDFYITPTLQFILGFLFNEPFNLNQLVSFILIWIAVFIYLEIYMKITKIFIINIIFFLFSFKFYLPQNLKIGKLPKKSR